MRWANPSLHLRFFLFPFSQKVVFVVQFFSFFLARWPSQFHFSRFILFRMSTLWCNLRFSFIMSINWTLILIWGILIIIDIKSPILSKHIVSIANYDILFAYNIAPPPAFITAFSKILRVFVLNINNDIYICAIPKYIRTLVISNYIVSIVKEGIMFSYDITPTPVFTISFPWVENCMSITFCSGVLLLHIGRIFLCCFHAEIVYYLPYQWAVSTYFFTYVYLLDVKLCRELLMKFRCESNSEIIRYVMITYLYMIYFNRLKNYRLKFTLRILSFLYISGKEMKEREKERENWQVKTTNLTYTYERKILGQMKRQLRELCSGDNWANG